MTKGCLDKGEESVACCTKLITQHVWIESLKTTTIHVRHQIGCLSEATVPMLANYYISFHILFTTDKLFQN